MSIKNNLIKHLSIKVPWHDNNWNGTICNNPRENLSCKKIKDLKKEIENSGKLIKDIKSIEDRPKCVNENGLFMSDYEYLTYVNHPYSKYNINYKKHFSHFKETEFLNRAYSITIIPYKWLKRKHIEDKLESSNYLIKNYDIEKEKNIIENIEKDFKNSQLDFIFDIENQRAALNSFLEFLKPNKSLSFFYTDEIPGLEKVSKILIGIGFIENISEEIEYNTNESNESNKLRSLIWERNIKHSIRPDFENGFLFPIKEIISYLENHQEYNIEDFVVTIPFEKREEFSYKSELVSNDTAIRLIKKCINIFNRIKEKINPLNFDPDKQIAWLNKRLIDIHNIRGNYPGLGAVLTEHGFDEGFLIAEDLNNLTKEDNDVWETVKKFAENPEKYLSEERKINLKMMKTKLDTLKDIIKKNNSEIKIMQLLSRFDLKIKQIKYIKNNLDKINESLKKEYYNKSPFNYKIDYTTEDIINNPYLLYELTINKQEQIDFNTIDFGLYNLKKHYNLYPFESNMQDKLDPRRINSLMMEILRENANEHGNSLVYLDFLINKIAELPLIIECNLNIQDIISNKEKLDKIELIEIENDKYACQLKEYAIIKNYLKEKILKRINAKKLDNSIDWKSYLKKNFDDDDDSLLEKEYALNILTESRFSILTGKAGTGKTTLIKIFCENDSICKDGVLLLAPTGKARIRLSNDLKKTELKSYTIAKFLIKHERFDSENMRYHFNYQNEPIKGFKTVIIDEASMLTEEMLASIFECLTDVDRYILVGDYRQLPPIGLGKPFVDIINYLKNINKNIENNFFKITNNYVELTKIKRQKLDKTIREDIELADYFAENDLNFDNDLIFEKISLSNDLKNIRFVPFENENDFEDIFMKVLIEELHLKNKEDKKGFNKTLGSDDGEKFYTSKPDKTAAVDKISDWQIITPIKYKKYGVKNITRIIQNNFKNQKDKIENTNLFYGDKVINVVNKKKNYYFNKRPGFTANGEIGIALTIPSDKNVCVEFDSQKDKIYEFSYNEIDKENNLEPAYAITVHKSQGSDFNKTFVIIPNPCLLLSKELIYTILTRHKEKIIIFYQDKEIFSLKNYVFDKYSEIAKRMTNLFVNPSFKEINGKYYDKNLIHCASDNTILRSKSELIIYERLLIKGLNEYSE